MYDSRLSKELQGRCRAAWDLAATPHLFNALHEEAPEPELREEARKDPHGFLRARGVKVPDGLKVTFIDFQGPRKPTPDYEFFTIRQFDCRTYYIEGRDEEGNRTIEEVEICWGLEIIPHPLPPIA